MDDIFYRSFLKLYLMCPDHQSQPHDRKGQSSVVMLAVNITVAIAITVVRVSFILCQGQRSQVAAK